MIELNYRDFCRESGCENYESIRKLSSFLEITHRPNPIKQQILRAKIYCKYKCIIYQFCHWMENKGIVKIASED